MSENLRRRYHGIGQGQHEHFEAEKLQNPSKIGVVSHKVGVAVASAGGALTSL